MSDGSQLKPRRQPRALRSEERDLLRTLLSGAYSGLASDLEDARVYDMPDGQMGSIRFLKPDSDLRCFGRVAVEADYLDRDGVLVSLALNLDQKGDLFELDSWKVDFTPLLSYPRSHELKIREVGEAPAVHEAAVASPK